jgi:hypothetical protein
MRLKLWNVVPLLFRFLLLPVLECTIEYIFIYVNSKTFNITGQVFRTYINQYQMVNMLVLDSAQVDLP